MPTSWGRPSGSGTLSFCCTPIVHTFSGAVRNAWILNPSLFLYISLSQKHHVHVFSFLCTTFDIYKQNQKVIMAPKGPYKLVTVNTAPERAKRLVGRVTEELKDQYTILHVANCESTSLLLRTTNEHKSLTNHSNRRSRGQSQRNSTWCPGKQNSQILALASHARRSWRICSFVHLCGHRRRVIEYNKSHGTIGLA